MPNPEKSQSLPVEMWDDANTQPNRAMLLGGGAGTVAGLVVAVAVRPESTVELTVGADGSESLREVGHDSEFPALGIVGTAALVGAVAFTAARTVINRNRA